MNVFTTRESKELKIQLNGEELTVAMGTTVEHLLQGLNKNPKFLAVEKNQELVPRAQHSTCALNDGDQIEIVTLVGGG